MNQKTLSSSFDQAPVILWTPDSGEVSRVIFALDGEKLIPLLLNSQKRLPALTQTALVSLSGENRLNSYTPWPCDALNERFPPFGGQADASIAQLSTRIIPEVREIFQDSNLTLALLGYSLGGLFSVYASFRTDLFRQIICLSGSFWYPGWREYVLSHAPACRDIRYAMACGEQEGSGKQTAQGQAVAMAQLTHERLSALNGDLPLLLDPGGHHDRLQQRLEAALTAI